MVRLILRSWEGSPFQVEGLTSENARICLVKVRENETKKEKNEDREGVRARYIGKKREREEKREEGRKLDEEKEEEN